MVDACVFTYQPDLCPYVVVGGLVSGAGWTVSDQGTTPASIFATVGVPRFRGECSDGLVVIRAVGQGESFDVP